MRVLLLSAYAARSHIHWQNALVAMFPQWSWQHLTLPPRHFSWRVRGNPLYWAIAEREVLEEQYDLLIVTSMVDLATLRGLVPNLARVPTVLYFHENQFDYPQDKQAHSLLEAQIVSLYSSLAADRVVFNSEYNRRSFFDGCAALLKRLPDKVPAGIVASLEAKSSVLPVPLTEINWSEFSSKTLWPGATGDYPSRPLRLLWLGRFEHDKGGEMLLSILEQLEREELKIEVAMIGQQFRTSPEVFRTIESRFGHILVQFGNLEAAADYRQYLHDADIVLSTALHEFQGIAVLEAVAAGCLPVVPDRLVYPEVFPAECCYPSGSGCDPAEAVGAAQLITSRAHALAIGNGKAPSVDRFSMEVLKPRYEEVFISSASE